MYEFRDLSLSHLGGSVSKYKEQGINSIGFSRTIGTDNRGERLYKTEVSLELE